MELNRDTYFTLFYHIVFSTKERQRTLVPKVLVRLLQYMIAYCRNNGTTPLIVNGVPDHIHMLLYVNSPSFSLPNFMRELKKSTNKLCNNALGYRGRFAWQAGYFAQALSRERVSGCFDYIKNQQMHHEGMTFAQEWEKLKAVYERDRACVEQITKGQGDDPQGVEGK